MRSGEFALFKGNIMKTFKKLLLIFTVAFVLVFVTGLLRISVSFMASSFFGSIAYFCVTLYFLKKFGNLVEHWLIFISLLLGLSVFQVTLRILDWEGQLISLPDFLIHILAVIVGYIYYKLNRIIGLSVTILAFGLIVFVCLHGYSLWIHKLTFGTFSGKVSEPYPSCTFFNEDSLKISNEDFKGKMVVLDFWHTACGVCFKKFPTLHEYFKKYNDQHVKIYSVNLPLDRDTLGQATRLVKELKYSFPVLFLHDERILEQLKISCFPTTLVIADGKEIVFRGDIENIEKILGK